MIILIKELGKEETLLKPKIILSLGDAATKTILNIKYKKFSDVVGNEYELDGMKVIPIYHPSPISPKSYVGNVDIFNEIKEKFCKYIYTIIQKWYNAIVMWL